MSLAPRLDLRQSQSLMMTPQLQQAIKLLALSNLEIEAFIAEEMEKNPLLDGGAEELRTAMPDDGDGFDAPDPATADELILQGAGAARCRFCERNLPP
jgi:RNA polymerase sigma-54 factor